MSGFQSPITIYNAMQYIKNGDYLLPAFQREFVWSMEQIEKLFDSIMQGYPISSMLFWEVKNEARSKFKFYRFLDKYVEMHQTHNEYQPSMGKDFFAVLDGQQRLTALKIGLFGSYAAHEYYKSWDYSPSSFPERELYLCITKTNSDEEKDKKYRFNFLKKNETNSMCLFKDQEGEKWFKVGTIIELHTNLDYDIDDFCEENNIPKPSKKIINLLDRKIFTELTINFYKEESQNADMVVSIFTRINSGGTQLSFANIMFSLLVANWEKDARTEIKSLIDRINDKGFSIDIEFFIKAILFLHHKTVKSMINNFSNTFCKIIEDNWNQIRDSIEALFDLLRSFGLDSSTLTSNNATLPILYYMYHSNKYKNFSNSVTYENDRVKMKKWLLSMLLRKAFGSHSDSVLTSARKAFSDDFEKQYIDSSIIEFPANSIIDNIKRSLAKIDDDFIDELLSTQKDNKYCFSILAILYPNLDYRNNNFHKDHLHPAARYKELSEEIKSKYSFADYNSIVNLQLLDANENESKGEKPLKDWVDKELKKTNSRNQFFESHLIPDVDLNLSNFEEYFETRKALLSEKLKSLLTQFD